MAEYAVIAAIAGTATAAYGQYQQGQAADARGRAEKDWHNYNAEISRRQAKEAEQKALADARLHSKRTRAIQAKLRAGYGASGVSMSDGSPLAVLEQSAVDAELDRLLILREGLLQSQGYESQAALDVGAGSMARLRGRNAKRSARWQAGATLLSGASSTYGIGREYGMWDK